MPDPNDERPSKRPLSPLMQQLTDRGVTVHYLVSGRPLCGFHNGVPRDWPEGHVWAYYGEEVNCEACIREVHQ
jgi:hypothetical protein